MFHQDPIAAASAPALEKLEQVTSKQLAEYSLFYPILNPETEYEPGHEQAPESAIGLKPVLPEPASEVHSSNLDKAQFYRKQPDANYLKSFHCYLNVEPENLKYTIEHLSKPMYVPNSNLERSTLIQPLLNFCIKILWQKNEKKQIKTSANWGLDADPHILKFIKELFNAHNASINNTPFEAITHFQSACLSDNTFISSYAFEKIARIYLDLGPEYLNAALGNFTLAFKRAENYPLTRLNILKTLTDIVDKDSNNTEAQNTLADCHREEAEFCFIEKNYSATEKNLISAAGIYAFIPALKNSYFESVYRYATLLAEIKPEAAFGVFEKVADEGYILAQLEVSLAIFHGKLNQSRNIAVAISQFEKIAAHGNYQITQKIIDELLLFYKIDYIYTSRIDTIIHAYLERIALDQAKPLKNKDTVAMIKKIKEYKSLPPEVRNKAQEMLDGKEWIVVESQYNIEALGVSASVSSSSQVSHTPSAQMQNTYEKNFRLANDTLDIYKQFSEKKSTNPSFALIYAGLGLLVTPNNDDNQKIKKDYLKYLNNPPQRLFQAQYNRPIKLMARFIKDSLENTESPSHFATLIKKHGIKGMVRLLTLALSKAYMSKTQLTFTEDELNQLGNSLAPSYKLFSDKEFTGQNYFSYGEKIWNWNMLDSLSTHAVGSSLLFACFSGVISGDSTNLDLFDDVSDDLKLLKSFLKDSLINSLSPNYLKSLQEKYKISDPMDLIFLALNRAMQLHNPQFTHSELLTIKQDIFNAIQKHDAAMVKLQQHDMKQIEKIYKDVAKKYPTEIATPIIATPITSQPVAQVNFTPVLAAASANLYPNVLADASSSSVPAKSFSTSLIFESLPPISIQAASSIDILNLDLLKLEDEQKDKELIADLSKRLEKLDQPSAAIARAVKKSSEMINIPRASTQLTPEKSNRMILG